MNHYRNLGPVALGSALRQLADQVTKDAENTYQKFSFNIDPKWFPVFYVLANNEADSIVDISKVINHSHVSVSNIVREMKKAGLVEGRKSKNDSRVTRITLTSAAKKMIPAMNRQCDAVDMVTKQLTKDTGIDLYEALKVSERHLRYRGISSRIEEIDKPQEVRLVDYAPKYQTAYRQLNIDWISQHWELEEPDHKSLDNPESYILDKGGVILIAIYKDMPVGCCALIEMGSGSYELAKMAVSPDAQGKGIGLLLGQAIIERAKLIGARRLYLESNSVLKPALNLYLKLGFKRIEGVHSPYTRCDVQMEKELN